MTTFSKRNVQNNIKKFRKEKNMKQLELAVACSITEGFLSDIERGRTMPSIETLIKISKVLKIHPGRFFEK